MKSRIIGWRTLPWWILILLIGIVVYWVVDVLLCIGLARFGSGPACSSLDAMMGAYRVLMKWAKYRHDELQALSGVAISVFTFFLAISAYRLWRHGVQLARLQARNAEAALTVTRDAAAASARSADAVRAALVAQQRPWVQVLAVELAADLAFDDAGATMELAVRVKNVGRSPALDVRVEVEVRSTEGSLAAPIAEPDDLPVGAALFPAQEAVLARRVMLPAALRDEMRQRLGTDAGASVARGVPSPAYVVGAAFYGTSLEGARRRTEFSFALRHRAASHPASAAAVRPDLVSVRELAVEPLAVGPRAAT